MYGDVGTFRLNEDIALRYKRQQQINRRGQASFEGRKSSLPGGYEKIAYSTSEKSTNTPTDGYPSGVDEDGYYGVEGTSTDGYNYADDTVTEDEQYYNGGSELKKRFRYLGN